MNQTAINTLKQIALAHPNINAVYEGNIFDLNHQTGTLYPLVFLEYETGNLTSNEVELQVKMYVIDRVVKDRSDSLQIQYDSTIVFNDILNVFTNYYDVDYPVNLTTFNQKFSDLTAGAFGDLNITECIGELGTGEIDFDDTPLLPCEYIKCNGVPLGTVMDSLTTTVEDGMTQISEIQSIIDELDAVTISDVNSIIDTYDFATESLVYSLIDELEIEASISDINTQITGINSNVSAIESQISALDFYTTSEVNSIIDTIEQMNESEVQSIIDTNGFATTSEVESLVNSLDYYTTSETDSIIQELDYYTTSEVDSIVTEINFDSEISVIESQIEALDFYTTSEVDSIVASIEGMTPSEVQSIIDTNDFATVSEVESIVNGLDYYTTSEVDSIVAEINFDSEISVIQSQIEALDYYTTSEVDSIIDGIDTMTESEVQSIIDTNEFATISGVNSVIDEVNSHLSRIDMDVFELEASVSDIQTQITNLDYYTTGEVNSIITSVESEITALDYYETSEVDSIVASITSEIQALDYYTTSEVDSIITNLDFAEVEHSHTFNENFLSDTVNWTLKDWFDQTQSAGRLTSEGDITANVDGTVYVPAGTGLVKDPATPTPPDLFANWENTKRVTWNEVPSLALTDEAYNFIYYEGSTNSIKATTNFYSISPNEDFTLGRAFRRGTSVIVRLCGTNLWNFNRRVQTFGEEVFPIMRATGMIMSNPSSRFLAVSAGIIWAELVNRFTTDAFDSSGTDTFSTWYRNGTGGWIEAEGNTLVNNLNYDDGTGTLAEINNNRYAVHYVFVLHDSSVHLVYGRNADYTLATAESATLPSDIPDILDSYGTFIGKVIVLKNGTTINRIQSSFVQQFGVTTTQNHNELGGIQGGAVGDRQHLTTAQVSIVDSIPSEISTINSTIDELYTTSEVDSIIDTLDFYTTSEVDSIIDTIEQINESEVQSIIDTNDFATGSDITSIESHITTLESETTSIESQISTLESETDSHISNTSIHYAQSDIQISLTQVTDAGDIAGKDYWTGTQAEYDAIVTKDPNTLYFIERDFVFEFNSIQSEIDVMNQYITDINSDISTINSEITALDFYTTSEVDSIITALDFYNTSEVDSIITALDFYTTSEVDSIITALDVMTESEVSSLIATYDYATNTDLQSVASDVSDIQSEINTYSNAVDYTIWTGTQAQYDALGTYDVNTIYYILEE